MYIRDHQELHINYLQDNDSGVYACKAKSRLGLVQSTITITVKGNLLYHNITNARSFLTIGSKV